MRLPRWCAHVRVAHADQLLAVHLDRALDLGRLRQQTHRREERDRFAGTALADDAEHLARADGYIDAANGLNIAAFGRECDAQIADLEYRLLVRSRPAHV